MGGVTEGGVSGSDSERNKAGSQSVSRLAKDGTFAAALTCQ